MGYINYLTYVFFGTLPGLIWLLHYLRKDVNPEPKRMILKVFFFGMLITLPAVFSEIAIADLTKKISFFPFLVFIFNIFLGVALVEELLKFLVVKKAVLKSPEFDEPVDAMIYMIVSGLGFATAENILVLFLLRSGFNQMFEISLLRFLGATFLHALASAIIGFFIGLTFFDKTHRRKLILTGMVLAVMLHGLYNFSIMSSGLIYKIFGIIIKVEGNLQLLMISLPLLISALFVSLGFQKLKKLKGTGKI